MIDAMYEDSTYDYDSTLDLHLVIVSIREEFYFDHHSELIATSSCDLHQSHQSNSGRAAGAKE